MRVSEALATLGTRAAAVAQGKGSSEAEWRSVAADSAAWVDRDGARFYVDPVRVDATASAPLAAAAADYTQTFLLHSNPTATRKLYLDFTGHTVSGTAWGAGATLVADAYSSDADFATFSTAEQDQIQSVWQLVAEDYAPFDIDVTTEDPGYAAINRASTTDNAFGSRVVITGTTSVYNAACSSGCGGVAYVGTIDSTGTNHDYYQPAWVFTNGVGYGAKNIAEATSHEAGHNLGLSHDGTAATGYYSGHAAWAPIMGVGYYVPVSQWSRGEYAGANQLQDDFAIAAANSIPLRTDDFGSTAAPTALGASPVSLSGVIHTRTDQDAFVFSTSGGTVSFSAAQAPSGADLDIRLDLLDASGAVVAFNDPAVAMVDGSTATGLGATISATVAAGAYRIVVDGVGFGDPLSTGYSDYGSLGAYSLTGSYPVGTNVAPIAVASATPSTGTAPVAVTYSSAGSADSDGTIAAYSWTFGDGTTSTAANPSKTYTTAGTYSATLRVTDNVGAVSAPSVVTVTVTAAVTKYVRVSTLSIVTSVSGGQRRARTTVTVTDRNGVPIPGVTVAGAYSGVVKGSVSGVTGVSGTVVLQSAQTKTRTGTFTFTVSSLAATGYSYVATDNLTSTVSVSY
jgi:PKD repeat protein